MNRISRSLFAVFASLLLVASPMFAAGTVSNTVVIPVSLSIPESVSLTLSTNSITLSTSAPSTTITLTAGWQVQSGHTSATVYSWFSAVPTANLNGTNFTLGSGFFSTSFNGSTPVFCLQTPFAGQSFGVNGMNCGTYTLTSQNVATDLNDSTTIAMTLAVVLNQHTGVGVYSGGILNVAFVVA